MKSIFFLRNIQFQLRCVQLICRLMWIILCGLLLFLFHFSLFFFSVLLNFTIVWFFLSCFIIAILLNIVLINKNNYSGKPFNFAKIIYEQFWFLWMLCSSVYLKLSKAIHVILWITKNLLLYFNLIDPRKSLHGRFVSNFSRKEKLYTLFSGADSDYRNVY